MNALLSWGWRVDIILVLCLLGGLYGRGWLQLRRKKHRLATGWRLLSYIAGLMVLALALMSPIDILGELLFWVHMVQHLLVIMIAPPLLFLASPYPVVIWGLPRNVRFWVVPAFNQRSPFRHYLNKLSSPGVVWFIFVSFLWAWHDPNLYDLALSNFFIHDLEHISFFIIGMLYWWKMTGAAPHFSKRLNYVQRLIYALSAIPPNMILGVALSFARTPTYTHYLTVPRINNLTALEDQHFGGLIMWIPGSMMYIVAALLMMYHLLEGEEQKPPLTRKHLEKDELLRAPGFKRIE